MPLAICNAHLYLNHSSFCVHSDVKFHVLHDGLHDALPVLLQRCVAVGGHANTANFDFRRLQESEKELCGARQERPRTPVFALTAGNFGFIRVSSFVVEATTFDVSMSTSWTDTSVALLMITKLNENHTPNEKQLVNE